MKGKRNESKTRSIFDFCFISGIWCLFVVAISGCDRGSEGDGISGTFNLEGEKITITPHVYETRREMQKAYEQRFGNEIDLNREGFAIATYDPFNGHRCEIHVNKIRSETDNRQFSTWGHEFSHCVYGLWHPEL